MHYPWDLSRVALALEPMDALVGRRPPYGHARTCDNRAPESRYPLKEDDARPHQIEHQGNSATKHPVQSIGCIPMEPALTDTGLPLGQETLLVIRPHQVFDRAKRNQDGGE